MPLEEGSTHLNNQYLEAHFSMLFINEHVVELSVILEVLIEMWCFEGRSCFELSIKKNKQNPPPAISSDSEPKGMLNEIHVTAT